MNNEMPEVLYIRPTHSDGKHFSCSLQSDTLKRTKYVRADKVLMTACMSLSKINSKIPQPPKEGEIK